MTQQPGARAHGSSRWRPRGDDGVAMMTTVMMMLVMTALSVLALGLVLNQVTPTQFAQKNTRTIFAAEAGLEASVGRIRSAVAAPDFLNKVYGNPAKLPCTVTGVVDTASGSTTYATTVRYYLDDPSGRSETWLNANKLACSDSGGTGTTLPAYAMISSQGDATQSAKVAATSGDRAISMVYRFETTTTNVVGGRIYSWNGTATSPFCLRADGLSAGSTVSYRASSTCGTAANEDAELWAYTDSHTLKLASSDLTATPLCLTDESGTIRLRACTPVSDSNAHLQRWSWHNGGNATWQAQASGLVDRNPAACLGSGRTSGNPVNGDKLQVAACANQAAWGSFSPDPAVGPGAASINTNQIVNYLEFGRCMDVTDVTIGRPFMISYPCKQDPPDGANILWNHKWYYSEPVVGTTAAAQPIVVRVNNSTDPAQRYCLKTAAGISSPSGYTGVGPDFHVTFKPCNAADATQQWIRSTATGDRTTSYTFRDSSGRCIGVGGDKYNGNWSTLVVSTCDGSTAQKWNAPPAVVEAEIGNYLEETS